MLRLLVNIDVTDIERAVAFYTEAFALTAGRRFRNDAVELLGVAVPIYLLAEAGDSTAAPGASAARTYGRHWTPVHLDFVVDDIAVALSRAEGAGAVREGEISTRPWGRLAPARRAFRTWLLPRRVQRGGVRRHHNGMTARFDQGIFSMEIEAGR